MNVRGSWRETLREMLAVYYLTAFEASLALMRFGYSPESDHKWFFDRNAHMNREIEDTREGHSEGRSKEKGK